MADYELTRNSEGYSDPTAHNGIVAAVQAEIEAHKQVSSLVFVLKYIINAAGYDLLNRIEIRDRKTWRVYR